MATGDQSGTWGDTTNTNLGTLLEQAITGYLSVAQGDVANLTLTTTNYASDQARNAVIRITGALTATRNVVIQTAAKLYTIANDTTGGFSIVVKTSAGTGVSIPPGAMMNVYSDGTNAVMGQNYWSGSIGGAVYLDAGAAVGPNYDLFRDSTSPAISDILGRVTFNGRDSAANKQEYASIEATIASPTSTTEGGALDFYATVSGTRTRIMAMSSTGLAVTGTQTIASSADGIALTLESTDAGTTSGPDINLYRNSASPLAEDSLGAIAFRGEDSAGNSQEYARIVGLINDPTSTSEDGSLFIQATIAGSRTAYLIAGRNAASVATASAVGLPLGQISFPATQNASSDANTLDDYEEGTFTPTISFGGAAVGVTYGTQSGSYTKIGNRVFGEIRLVLTAKGSSTGSASVEGLPFTVSSARGGAGIGSSFNFTGLTGALNISVGPSSTACLVRQSSATGNGATTDANFTATTDFAFSFHYSV